MTTMLMTGHGGSLPRPDSVIALLESDDPDSGRRDDILTAAVGQAVALQVAAGINYVSDGEMSRRHFMSTGDRLTGFQGEMYPYRPSDLAGTVPSSLARLPRHALASNDSRDVSYLPEAMIAACERFSEVLAGYPASTAGVLASPAPGTLARLGSSVYDRQEFLDVLADAMHEEYQIIVDYGFMLQLDDPESAMGKHVDYQDLPIEGFREIVRQNVRAANRALDGIPPERVRFHACYGNYPGSHVDDIALADIIDLLYQVNADTLVLPFANPRHHHEWRVFEKFPLPERMVLAAGVVDPLNPVAEHAETVADTLIQLARLVGQRQLVAATDCGFSTFAGAPEALPETVRSKLRALTDGAAIASTYLWS
jgi:5-methyltetrahydropteroyltriglutamate--homocysteine methyltransferase